MTLLITGASGYLGAELMRQAPDAAGTHATRPVPRSTFLDVRDSGAVRRAVDGHDTVIHTAYDAADADVTAGGSVAVADACAASGARLVQLSTDIVFSGTLGRALTEDDPPDPVTDYGRAKLVAEREVAARCPGAAIVRTSLIYGERGSPPGAQEALAFDTSLTFFTDELRNPIAVADLARALLDLTTTHRDFAGILHVAGADEVSRLELARLIAAAHGRDPEALRGGTLAGSGLNRPADCRLDSSRALALLGWAPRGVRQVLGVAADYTF